MAALKSEEGMRWKRGWLANNAREEGRRKTRLAEQKTKECSQADTRALPSTLNNRGCRVYEKKKTEWLQFRLREERVPAALAKT